MAASRTVAALLLLGVGLVSASDLDPCFAATGCDDEMTSNNACDLKCMVPACMYDGGECNSIFPSSTEFDNYLHGRHRGRDVTVNYGDVNLTAYKVPDNTTEVPINANVSVVGSVQDQMRNVFANVTKEEFDFADVNGDGLQAEEAFALYIYKLEQNHYFVENKYQLLAMAWMSFYYEDDFQDIFEFNERGGKMHNGRLISLMGLSKQLSDIDDIFSGGYDKMTWPETADKSAIEFLFRLADVDDDNALNPTEAATIGIKSSMSTDLFGWLDMDDDNLVSLQEAWSTYESIIEDGQKSKFVCNGLEILDATHGKIDSRFPMGVAGSACGWLIMPSWFYKQPPNREVRVSNTADASANSKRSAHKAMPRAGSVAMRSKAHRRLSKELKSKDDIKSAARRLMSTHPAGDGGGSGDSEDEAAKSFLVSITIEETMAGAPGQPGPPVHTHMCSGALIGKTTVLTTAMCLKKVLDRQVEFSQGLYDVQRLLVHVYGEDVSKSGLSKEFSVSGTPQMHPSALFDLQYDIGVVTLDRASNARPAHLYDGGDLGISDCKRMKLSYLSWGNITLGLDTNSSKMTMVKLHDHRDCQKKYHAETGSAYDEVHGHGTDGGVGTSEICVVTDPKDATPQGPCFGDLGLPLTARVKGVDGSVLLGLAHSDDCGSGLPAVFTRVSSSLQWIRATVPELSAHPHQYTMKLMIEELGLPTGATLKIFEGPNFEQGKMVADGELETKCSVPWETETSKGAMLIVLEMPERVPECDNVCVDTMAIKASFALNDCEECTENCSLSVKWDKMGPMFEDKGKGYTGGLGKRMVKRIDKEFGVWACVRDWDDEEQMACGAQHNELACFWFEEKSREFQFKGLNEQTRLVTPAQHKHGMDVEDGSLRERTLATSPDQSHH